MKPVSLCGGTFVAIHMTARRGQGQSSGPEYKDEPFREAVNAPVLHAAFDQIVGKDRWVPRKGLGTFPVRFPHPDDPGDAGWHVDVSFPGDDCDPNEAHDFSSWRVNVTSRGRAL